MHYEPASEPASGHPDFTKTKYPAKEAIKCYSGGNFPIKSVAEAASDAIPKPKLENTSSNNIKITNDTPLGPVNNDKSYTRITKSSSHGGPKPALAVAGKGVVEADDAAESTASEEDVSDDLWNSFSFGVVSDTLNYHDPYEGRKGDYKRKTNAISKIEKMMGKEYSSKEIAEASGTSTPSNSRVRRSEIPHKRPIMRHKPTTHQQLTSVKEEKEEKEERKEEMKEEERKEEERKEEREEKEEEKEEKMDKEEKEDKKLEKVVKMDGKAQVDYEYPKYYEPEYDEDHIRIFGYDIRGYDLSTLKLIDAYEREARDAGKFRPLMFNPHIPDLTMDTDGSWKTPIAHQSRLTKRDWPEHIKAKAEKMMHSAKEMQAKGQLVIDNDPAYQNSLREKKAREKEAREKELAAAQAAAEAAEDEEENLFNLIPPTGKSKGSVGPNRKAYPVDMTDDVANPPPQNIQSGSKTAKVPKQPAIQGHSKKLVHPVHKQPNQSNGNATAPCKNTNSAPQKQQHPQPHKKKRPMGNFPKKGGAMARFKKNPLRKRDIAYPAGHVFIRLLASPSVHNISLVVYMLTEVSN